MSLCSLSSEFFLFLYYFVFDLSKIYVAIIFLQKCHPAAGSFGGKELPPDEPAVRSLAHGPWNLPPFDPAVASMGRGPRILPPVHPAVTPYRQTNRRQGDIFAKKL